MNRTQRRKSAKVARPETPAVTDQALLIEAVKLHQGGSYAEAENIYRRFLVRHPDHAWTLYALGLALYHQNKLEPALAAFRKSSVLDPASVEAFANIGASLKRLGRWGEAEAAFRQELALAPASAQALGDLGGVLIEQGRHEEAIGWIEKALAVEPNNVFALCNLLAATVRQERHQEGVALARRIISLHPEFLIAHFNLGIALKALGRFDEAVAAVARVAALEPNFAEGHYLLAQIYLTLGDFVRGWEEYEWRWKLQEYEWIRDVVGDAPKPVWSNEDLSDKTIMICAEQGLGDTLQFVRFLPYVVAQAKQVIFLIQPPLKPLLGALAGVTLVGLDVAPPDYDLYCPLLSLPRRLKITLDNLPAGAPYFRANPLDVERWGVRIGEHGFKIGIAWQGKPGVKVDRGRSFPLAELAPLARIPGVRLISLQKNFGMEQLSELPEGMKVETLGDDYDAGPGAFLDASAVMMNLDLVVSSDTAIAHLAGALGCPTWLALKTIPDWRWLLSTSRSPWYSSMRLFRQTSPGDWSAVFAEMAAALPELTTIVAS